MEFQVGGSSQRHWVPLVGTQDIKDDTHRSVTLVGSLVQAEMYILLFLKETWYSRNSRTGTLIVLQVFCFVFPSSSKYWVLWPLTNTSVMRRSWFWENRVILLWKHCAVGISETRCSSAERIRTQKKGWVYRLHSMFMSSYVWWAMGMNKIIHLKCVVGEKRESSVWFR